MESSRVRPTNAVGLPSSRGAAPCWMRSPPRTQAAARSAPPGSAPEHAGGDVVELDGAGPRAPEHAHAALDDLALDHARRDQPAAGDHADGDVGQVRPQRQRARAARSARSTALPAPHSVTSSDRPGELGEVAAVALERGLELGRSACGWRSSTASASGSPANTTVTRRCSLRVMRDRARGPRRPASVGASRGPRRRTPAAPGRCRRARRSPRATRGRVREAVARAPSPSCAPPARRAPRGDPAAPRARAGPPGGASWRAPPSRGRPRTRGAR